MSLFKSKKRLNVENNASHLLSIEDSIQIYQKIEATKTGIGQDISQPDFVSKGVALLESKGVWSQEIPMRCDHYILFLCLEGQTDKIQNQHKFRFEKQQAHLIQPGEIHAYSNTSGDFRTYMLLFDQDYLAKSNLDTLDLERILSKDVDRSPLLNLGPQNFEQWKSVFRHINSEYVTESAYYQQLIVSYLTQLLIMYKRAYGFGAEANEMSTQKRIFRGFRSLIEQYFQHMKTVNEYAELMDISSKHLSETVKKVSNHAALYYIQERIIRESQYLLVYTRLNIKQIAYRLNFDTPSHFIRFFKKHSGVTPLKFRTSYRLNK